MISRTLRLTTPLMRGNDVKAAQSILISRGYLGQKLSDGVYGPVTANAAKSAKYALGYRLDKCDTTYGRQLDDYLRAKKKPSRIMMFRAAQRAKKPVSTIGVQTAEVMTRWAEAYWHESPSGSNYVPELSKLAKRLGASAYILNMRYPWCGMGLFTAALSVGAVSGRTGIKDELWNALYTPTIQQMAREGRYGLRAVSVRQGGIEKGTGLLFDFDGGGVDHVGIALGKPGQVVTIGGQKWKPKRSQVVTVECNTSLEGQSGSQSDGGCVAIRIRDLSLIATAFSIT